MFSYEEKEQVLDFQSPDYEEHLFYRALINM